MSYKMIGPTAHGVIDYGFAAMNALAPTLFGLEGRARTLSYVFAGTSGALNAMTDHPVGMTRVVPLSVHGRLETPFVPALILLPWMTGAMRQRNARLYFSAMFALAVGNYLLTDYKAQDRQMLRRARETNTADSVRKEPVH